MGYFQSTPSSAIHLTIYHLYIQTLKSSPQSLLIQTDGVVLTDTIPNIPLDFIPLIYTDNKVKLSVYPCKRIGIVSTASHPIFSFDCIPIFLFSSLILSSKPNICM